MQLASRLTEYKDNKAVLLLALPRGGVVIGFEVARYLKIPMDVLIVRKIGLPVDSELAVAAVSETGAVALNDFVISTYGVTKKYITDEILSQQKEIKKRIDLYRNGRALPELEDKIILLTDDGVATGATIKATITALKKEKLKRLIIALPVAPPQVAEEIGRMVDELICIETPSDFMSVGSYYRNFSQVTDEEVMGLLKEQTGGSMSGKQECTMPVHDVTIGNIIPRRSGERR